MSKPNFHTLIICSDLLIVHEITNGPLRPKGTVFADFAPEDSEQEKAAAYQAELIQQAAQFQVRNLAP